MTEYFIRNDLPDHVFAIPELDFSEDLLVNHITGPWIRIGAWTTNSCCDPKRVTDEIRRESVLLSQGDFTTIFNDLNSIGNTFSDLGQPSCVIQNIGSVNQYNYFPFHQFQFSSTEVNCEPLVFVQHNTSDSYMFINPDLWLFFALEEKGDGKGIWWDPKRGIDVLIHRVINEGNLKTVEIRTDYLMKYLQARQKSLLIGHFRQLLLFFPSDGSIEQFIEGDIEIGSPDKGMKGILQNWGLREAITNQSRFLQRRLHLWCEIKPPAIDINDPWAEEPPFDPYTFTFPTSSGEVAPARWRRHARSNGQKYTGNCDFMQRIYFRQEVLVKYEGAAGFNVRDDGSVSCHSFWALSRSTHRVGNELLSTAIGDFAEGVPFEEWPHWKQYSVFPPSQETYKALTAEMAIPEAVNTLVIALEALATAFNQLATVLAVAISVPIWDGSLDSLACRQLKWVYSSNADDEEFLKRATLTSTIVIDGLQTAPLRKLLDSIDKSLYKSFENQSKPLSSRNLIQRITLIAVLLRELQPELAELPALVKQAEGKATNVDPDLQIELERLFKQVRGELAPLAFLYDLRIHGGFAHPPNKEKLSIAAVNLGLPNGNWHRTDYLKFLKLITDTIERISESLQFSEA